MEEILLQNSKNITALIHLMKVHEENIKRYKMEMSEEADKDKDKDKDKDVIMKQNVYIECPYSSLPGTSVKRCPMSRSFFSPNDTVILVRECGHVFKKTSFLEWVAYHSTCPSCTARLS